MNTKRRFYFPDPIKIKRRRRRSVGFLASLAYKYIVVGSIILWLLLSNIATLYSITGKNPFDFPANHKDYLLFISISTALTGIFPASYVAYLYYKNNKSQTSNIRNDLKLLGLVTEEEYDEFDKMYETFHTPMQFGVFILLLSIISNLILAFFYVTRQQNHNYLQWNFPAELLFYAFLGSYLFGVRLVIRRYNTFDLQPQVYASIVLRIIISGTIAVGISALFLGNDLTGSSGISPQASITSDSQALLNEANVNELQERQISAQTEAGAVKDLQGNEILPWQILAFLIGVFPEQGLRWLSIIARRAFRDSTINQFNERPLRKIVGINEWHEARLEELGIDDAQGLATANISKLLLTTQFDTMQIVNWVDQAILHMKAGTRIDQFLAFQITTYSDLYYLLKKIYLKKIISHKQNNSNNVSENSNEPFEAERVYAKFDKMLTEIKGAKQSSSHEDDEYDKLLISLGFSYSDLERLCDYSNYPNFISIQEYYRNRDGITREQSRQGTEEIIKSIDIGGEILDIDDTLRPESLTAQQLYEIELNIQELRFQLFSCRSPRHGIDIGLNLGKLLYLNGYLEEASTMFDRCLEVASENNINGEIRSRIYAGRGLVNIALGIKFRNIYFQSLDTNNRSRSNGQGNLKEDYKAFFEAAASDNIFATNLNPSNVDAFNNCALAYIEQENFDLAMQYLGKALQLDQRNGVAYYNRGIVRNTIGKTEREFIEADLDFERAYLLGYQPSALWGTWGLTLVNIGRYQEAVKHLSRAISLNSNNHSFVSRRGFAYFQLSREAKLSGDLTTFSAYANLAGKDFKAAIHLIENTSIRKPKEIQYDLPENFQKCPKNALLAKIYINYGSLKILENAYLEAILIYSEFFKKETDKSLQYSELNEVATMLELNEVATMYYNLANAHFRLGEQKGEDGREDLEKAAELYQKAIDKNRDLIEAYYQIAMVFSRLNRAKEAQNQCDTGLRKLNEFLNKGVPSERHNLNVGGDNIGVMTSRLRDLENKLKALKEKLNNSNENPASFPTR